MVRKSHFFSTFSIAALLIIHFSLIIQNCYPQTPTWTRVFGGPSNDFGHTVFQTRDNGFLMIGQKTVNSVSQTYLVKFSFDGNIIWQRIYGDSVHVCFAYGGVEDSHGNIYVAQNQSGVKLMKLDYLGYVLWIRSYPNSIINFWNLCFTLDHKFIVVEAQIQDPLFFSTAGLIKLDTSGNLIWSKKYSNVSEVRFGRLLVNSYEYYVVGNVYNPSNQPLGYIFKVDSSGGLIWYKIFYNGIKSFDAVTLNSTNTYIATGGYVVPNTNSWAPCCLEFDSAGNVLWQRNYFGDSIEPLSITRTMNNNFAIVGGDLYGKSIIISIDSSGYIVNHKYHYYQPENLIRYECINRTNDSGFIITGFFDSLDYWWTDCIVVKTDKYGNTTPIGIKSISDNVPFSFSLFQNYPNPFNPKTIIKFSIPLSRGVRGVSSSGLSVQLVIYDILGREVASVIPPLWGGQEGLGPGTYEVEFDGSNFASGIYFYRLTARQGGTSILDFIQTKKMVLLK